MSDTLSGTTHPDDNDDHPWWGLPCTVTPCFGARLVQEGNRLHYLADRAGNRARYLNQDLIVLVRCRKPVIFRVGICVGIGWCCLLLTILNHEVKSHV
ncbi:hypothetical protein DDX49_003640 [Escherichia coli]|nr:hypothetical protein [Escherichia coli]